MEKETQKTLNIENIIDKAINEPAIPKLYANGFVTAVGQGDLLLVFQQNGLPLVTLNLSFTLAKTLALKLGQAINNLENQTGNTIMTSDDINSALQDSKGKDNEA
jgi:hypothetical protein